MFSAARGVGGSGSAQEEKPEVSEAAAVFFQEERPEVSEAAAQEERPEVPPPFNIRATLALQRSRLALASNLPVLPQPGSARLLPRRRIVGAPATADSMPVVAARIREAAQFGELRFFQFLPIQASCIDAALQDTPRSSGPCLSSYDHSEAGQEYELDTPLVEQAIILKFRVYKLIRDRLILSPPDPSDRLTVTDPFNPLTGRPYCLLDRPIPSPPD